jgi:hypothetical protein
MAREPNDPPESDAPPPAENSGITAGTPEADKARGRPFAAGQSGNPGGRPSSSREFRQLARDYSPTALKKLYQIALTGTGQAAVRACEIIIERAWGKTPLEVSGPKGAPLDTRFYGAARAAIEQAITKAAADEAEAQVGKPGPKN